MDRRGRSLYEGNYTRRHQKEYERSRHLLRGSDRRCKGRDLSSDEGNINRYRQYFTQDMARGRTGHRGSVVKRFHQKYDGGQRGDRKSQNVDGDLKESSREKEYDEWMRDQEWIRNYEGSWERRDGRYWEKMQYYEKYREWEMERTLKLEERKELYRHTGNSEKGDKRQTKQIKQEWKRCERGSSSTKGYLLRRSSSTKEYYPMCGDTSTDEAKDSSDIGSSTSSNAHSKKRSRSSESSSPFDDDKSNRRISYQENESPQYPKSNKKKRFNQVYLPKSKADRNDTERVTKKNNLGSSNTISTSQRFTEYQDLKQPKLGLGVDMVNMEVTVVTHTKKGTLARNLGKENKSTESSRDKKEESIEMGNFEEQMKSLAGSNEKEESLTTDEDNDSMESSNDSDGSSEESSSLNTEESSLNTLSESSDDGNKIVLPKVTEMEDYKEKLQKTRNDDDSIDLNASQDLFKSDPLGDKWDNASEKNILAKEEENIKKLEENVASIEQQILDLRSKLI